MMDTEEARIIVPERLYDTSTGLNHGRLSSSGGHRWLAGMSTYIVVSLAINTPGPKGVWIVG